MLYIIFLLLLINLIAKKTNNKFTLKNFKSIVSFSKFFIVKMYVFIKKFYIFLNV